jgi:hypothetical protein
MMAGRVSAPDAAAVRVGAAIESRARATYRPVHVPTSRRAEQPSLIGRLKAVLAAA